MSVKIEGMDSIPKELKKMGGEQSMSVKAGVLEGATAVESNEPVIVYAMFNEYGTETIPPRPFMRHTYDTYENEWYKLLREYLSAGYPPEIALEYVGMQMEDDIKASINEPASDWKPANSLETLKRKKSDKPLIDHSNLLKSIEYKVES